MLSSIRLWNSPPGTCAASTWWRSTAASVGSAEALFLTPSGLSLLLRELENQLGFRLFDRKTHHLRGATRSSRTVSLMERTNVETVIVAGKVRAAAGIARNVFGQ